MENTDKLLAEFLGMKPHHNDSNVMILNINGIKYPFEVSELNYDTDWNRLMLVVDKIESLNFAIKVVVNEALIFCEDWESLDYIYAREETKIESVYNACVEFVKWYNEQKK
jgi:hypothetical protein